MSTLFVFALIFTAEGALIEGGAKFKPEGQYLRSLCAAHPYKQEGACFPSTVPLSSEGFAGLFDVDHVKDVDMEDYAGRALDQLKKKVSSNDAKSGYWFDDWVKWERLMVKRIESTQEGVPPQMDKDRGDKYLQIECETRDVEKLTLTIDIKLGDRQVWLSQAVLTQPRKGNPPITSLLWWTWVPDSSLKTMKEKHKSDSSAFKKTSSIKSTKAEAPGAKEKEEEKSAGGWLPIVIFVLLSLIAAAAGFGLVWQKRAKRVPALSGGLGR